MKREDLERLLGGYATGTLTDEERRALFEVALTDQALFDALAGEEALREVLEDPRCRRRIEQALGEHPAGLVERAAGWIRRPRAWALAGTLAAAAAIGFVVISTEREPQQAIQLAQRREVEAPAPAPVPVPEFTPAPAPEPAAPPAPVQRERQMASRPLSPPAQKPAPEKQEAPPPPAPAFAPPPPPSSEVAAVADASVGPMPFSAGAEASGLPPVQCEILVRNPEGQFVEADRRAPVAPGTAVRLVLTPPQPGSLAVYNEERRLLFSTNAVAGARYTVDPPSSDRRFTVVLAPATGAVPMSARTAMQRSAEQAGRPVGRVITVIDLTRPRD